MLVEVLCSNQIACFIVELPDVCSKSVDVKTSEIRYSGFAVRIVCSILDTTGEVGFQHFLSVGVEKFPTSFLQAVLHDASCVECVVLIELETQFGIEFPQLP